MNYGTLIEKIPGKKYPLVAVYYSRSRTEPYTVVPREPSEGGIQWPALEMIKSFRGREAADHYVKQL